MHHMHPPSALRPLNLGHFEFFRAKNGLVWFGDFRQKWRGFNYLVNHGTRGTSGTPL